LTIDPCEPNPLTPNQASTCPICDASIAPAVQICPICQWSLTPTVIDQTSHHTINPAIETIDQNSHQTIDPVIETIDQNSSQSIDPASKTTDPMIAQITDQARLDHDRLQWARKQWAKLEENQKTAATLSYLQDAMQWLVAQIEPLSATVQHLADRLDQLEATLQSRSLALTLDWQTPLLASACGLDYTPLAQFLSERDWRNADEWTWQAILSVTNRSADGWISVDDIAQFPATDLQTIAGLWQAYSENQFGLATQIDQWQQAGCDYGEFCDRVGWRDSKGWKYYSDLAFAAGVTTPISAAPLGHFPAIVWRKRACYGTGGNTAAEVMTAWVDRGSNLPPIATIALN